MMSQYGRFRQQSRKAALSGVLTALATVILSAGSLIPLATFACPMLAMLCLLPILCECGAKYTLLSYAAASFLSLMFCADKEMALFYLFLGWYPAVRPRLSRFPRPLRILVKCGLFTLSMSVMYLLIIYIFRLEAVVEEFSEYSTLMLTGLLVIGNVTFLLLDRLLRQASSLYTNRRRRR